MTQRSDRLDRIEAILEQVASAASKIIFLSTADRIYTLQISSCLTLSVEGCSTTKFGIETGGKAKGQMLKQIKTTNRKSKTAVQRVRISTAV